MKITYRVIELKNDPDGDKYGLFEVYEPENGKYSWPEAADLYGDDLDVMKREVESMLQAFDMPIFKG